VLRAQDPDELWVQLPVAMEKATPVWETPALRSFLEEPWEPSLEAPYCHFRL
jgi:hypothetical protein